MNTPPTRLIVLIPILILSILMLLIRILMIPISIYCMFNGNYGPLLALIGIGLIEFTSYRNRKEGITK